MHSLGGRWRRRISELRTLLEITRSRAPLPGRKEQSQYHRRCGGRQTVTHQKMTTLEQFRHPEARSNNRGAERELRADKARLSGGESQARPLWNRQTCVASSNLGYVNAAGQAPQTNTRRGHFRERFLSSPQSLGDGHDTRTCAQWRRAKCASVPRLVTGAAKGRTQPAKVTHFSRF